MGPPVGLDTVVNLLLRFFSLESQCLALNLCLSSSIGGHCLKALPASAADYLSESPARFKSCSEAEGCWSSRPASFHPHQGGPTFHWAAVCNSERWGLWSEASTRMPAAPVVVCVWSLGCIRLQSIPVEPAVSPVRVHPTFHYCVDTVLCEQP